MAAADRCQSRFDVFHRIGEVFNEFGAIVEADHKEFILWIGGLDELHNRLTRADKLGRHGSAQVENDTDRYRRILAGKRLDLLLAAVLEDLEVLLFKAGHQT